MDSPRALLGQLYLPLSPSAPLLLIALALATLVLAVRLALPIPLFDRNQGAIEAQLQQVQALRRRYHHSAADVERITATLLENAGLTGA